MPSRIRRGAVDDQIEEVTPSAQATQDSVHDVTDDDEDMAPGPSRKKAKANSKAPAKKAKGKSVPGDDDDDDAPGAGEDSDGDDAINVDAFGNQALSRKDAQNLRSLSADWAQLATLAHSVAGDAMPEIGAALAEAGEPAAGALKELEALMREMVDLDEMMRTHQTVLDDMYQRVTRGEDVKDVKEKWKAETKAQHQAYAAKTTRQKYVKNDAYKTFRERIYEVEHDETMPSLKDLIPREAGDEESDDEDIEIGGATQDFKCPLTLQRLENPVTSRVCKHSYTKAAIEEYIGPGAGKKKCPAGGCGHMIGRADLEEDKGLARRVRDAARREEDRRERERAANGADDALDVDIDDD